MVGFPPIDVQFRGIGEPLRRGVDLREDYVLGILRFRDACSYSGSLVDCFVKVCSRARECGLKLSLKAVGKVCKINIMCDTIIK